MGWLNKKKSKKLDLLEMSDSERVKLIKELRENLRQKVTEAKLWQALINAENLTINGENIHHEEAQLKGIYLNDLVRIH